MLPQKKRHANTLARGRKISWRQSAALAWSGSTVSLNTTKDEQRQILQESLLSTQAPICLWLHTHNFGEHRMLQLLLSVPKSEPIYLNAYSISWLQGGISKHVIWPPGRSQEENSSPSLLLEHVFPWKRAASGKDPLCSGVAVYCNTLVWQRRLRRPCSCPGQRPGALAEGASSRVQVFYESQTCTRGPMPSSVCSWFYQLPFLIKLI